MPNDSLNRMLSAANATDAFVKTLDIVREHGVVVPADESKSVGSNRPTRELLNVTVCIDNPRDRLIRLSKYRTPLVASVARFVWMMAGNNRLADIAFYEERAKLFSDDGLTMAGSNYGMRLLQPRPGLNQLSGVISELQEHPSSRRAMVAIFQPEDAIRQNSVDIPCTFGFDYLVRGGKLLATTIMRSNNAIGLLPFNLFEFSMLAEIIAVETGSKLGSMSHIAMSMHIYEQELSRANDIVAGGALTGRSSQMLEMPPKPIEAINQLTRLEADLRHSGHLINDDTIDNWTLKAEELGSYWGQFYLILLFRSANKVSRSAARAVLGKILPPFQELMPDATGPKDSQPLAPPLFAGPNETGLNIVTLDSKRMRSVRRHLEQMAQAGKQLSVGTMWDVQEHFLRVAARGGDVEVSGEEFSAALSHIQKKT